MCEMKVCGGGGRVGRRLQCCPRFTPPNSFLVLSAVCCARKRRYAPCLALFRWLSTEGLSPYQRLFLTLHSLSQNKVCQGNTKKIEHILITTLYAIQHPHTLASTCKHHVHSLHLGLHCAERCEPVGGDGHMHAGLHSFATDI